MDKSAAPHYRYVALGCLLLALPIFVDYYVLHVTIFAGINLIVVLGLALLIGFSGQVSIGHAAFYGIGAYTSALLTMKLGFPFWVALPMAGIAAGLAGVILGVPSLKVANLYLIMTTVGFSIIVWLIMTQWYDLTNGPNGITDIPYPSIGSFEFDSPFKYYYLVLFSAVVAFLLMWRIANSSIGLQLRAIRDGEQAAKSVGVNSVYFRVLAFVISAVYAGIGGGLYAHYVTMIHPDNFNIMVSVTFLVMAVFCGQRNLFGIVIAVVVLTFSTEYFRVLGNFRMIGFGLLLVLVMVFFPEGIGSIKIPTALQALKDKFGCNGQDSWTNHKAKPKAE